MLLGYALEKHDGDQVISYCVCARSVSDTSGEADKLSSTPVCWLARRPASSALWRRLTEPVLAWRTWQCSKPKWLFSRAFSLRFSSAARFALRDGRVYVGCCFCSNHK